MVDLNTLIPPNSPFHLYAASFIDDRGEIAAFGVLANGDTHALVLIPCDENHSDGEDCEDCEEGVQSVSAVSQGSPVPRDVFSGTQRLSPPSRTNRFRFPGFALGPKN